MVTLPRWLQHSSVSCLWCSSSLVLCTTQCVVQLKPSLFAHDRVVDHNSCQIAFQVPSKGLARLPVQVFFQILRFFESPIDKPHLLLGLKSRMESDTPCDVSCFAEIRDRSSPLELDLSKELPSSSCLLLVTRGLSSPRSLL
ncbi:uncharacterized protein G2W53_033820 [Senna tora]|uniref:Secreted protein n=1 Tax=Senna tora TaxID=362788 RepID=A0A834SZC6_9FABA|nr:uncharacterized protein G2W53_033820 [Senna tora]